MPDQDNLSINRHNLISVLGDLPALPKPFSLPIPVRIIDTPAYTQYEYRIANGHDSEIPVSLLTPTIGTPPYPAVLYLHAHGHRYDRGRQELFLPRAGDYVPAQELTGAGFAVLCSDAYAFGERQHPDEMTRFKSFLWQGKTLWGMMLRDDLITLDFLCAHPEIDAARIAAAGMSMGSTRAWWLGALDARVATVIAVACLTRYQDLIDANGLGHHSIYFYVPGILKQFDTETILSLIAPRPLLCLTGDQDPTSPIAGIHTIESLLQARYRSLGGTAHFKSIVYENTGHTFTVQMWDEMMQWLKTHLTT